LRFWLRLIVRSVVEVMIDVVLPSLNEAAALPWVLRRMPTGFRPIVVDNGSTDQTVEVARAHGTEVVREPRRGFGAACEAGLRAATADVVAFCDADGSLDPALLSRVTGPVVAGQADLVLGRRRATEWRAWPVHARLGNAALAWSVRRRAGVEVRDIGPMRAAGREALLALALKDRRFGYPLEMVVRAAAAGWRLREVDVAYRPRAGGRSKVTGSVRGTLRAVHDMRRVLGRNADAP
jgi:glycosyltransferase involved in cell wall biosynthesis